MRKPAPFRTWTTALAVVIAATFTGTALSPLGSGSAAGAPSSSGTRVPLTPQRRGCDGGLLVNNFWGKMPAGSGEVTIRTSGNTVSAELQFVNTGEPGMHYDVVLIQAPRPASFPCGPGSPDTVSTGMDVDGGGRATVTLTEPIRQGTTGVWLQVTRPHPNSQDPVEYYSTASIAKI